MLKCPHCGALNDEGSRFCVQCGTRLPPATAPSAPPAPEGPRAAGAGAGSVSGPPAPSAAPALSPPREPVARAEPARKPPRRSLMQTLGLAPAPSPTPAIEPAPTTARVGAPPLAQTQTGMGAAGNAHLPLRPSAPELLVTPLAPQESQLTEALTDAADRVAAAPKAPGSLAAALTATAPRSRAPAAAVAPVVPPPGATALGGKAADAAAQTASALPFGDLLDDIDDGFDRIVQEPGAATAATSGEDYREVKGLFEAIAATHMGPVRDFMIELGLGDPPREWLELVLPAVRSLRTSAAGMGLGDLVAHLEAFVSALEVTATLDEARIGGEARDRLTASYAGLVAVMPAAFGLDEERDRREPIIVQSLLKQVPEVRKVALDKLYAAGLTSLAMYYVAKPYDIAEATGLSRDVSARIIERFTRYREDVAELTPDAGRSRERAQLDDLRRRLVELNEDFDLASRERSPGAAADKRRLRGERNEVVLQIDVLLARLGEVALVERLERLPFHGKVAALDGYLAEAKAKGPPPPAGPTLAR